MTSHIIVQAKGQNSSIKLVKAGTIVQGEYESWILDTGKRILFVHNDLHRKLKSFHLLGSFQSGAMYGFTYEETCALLREFLGQSDKDLYIAAVNMDQSHRAYSKGVKTEAVSIAAVGTLHIVAKGLLLTMKFIGTMMLIPFLISWLTNKHK